MSAPPRELEAIPAAELPAAIRRDVVLVRYGLAGVPAGPDRAEAQLALERLVRRLVREEEVTQERAVP